MTDRTVVAYDDPDLCAAVGPKVPPPPRPFGRDWRACCSLRAPHGGQHLAVDNDGQVLAEWSAEP